MDKVKLTNLITVFVFALSSITLAGFEQDFESFTLGAINGQEGWTSPAGTVNVVNSGIPNFGDRSVQVTSAGPDYFLVSPQQAPGYSTLSIDLVIDSLGGRMDIDPLANGIQTTSLIFQPNGSISVAETLASCLNTSSLTAGTWSPGVPFNLTWSVEPAPNGSVLPYSLITMDGAVIWDETISFGCGSTTPDAPGGFGLTAHGNTPIDMTIDNVSFQHHPADPDIWTDGVLDIRDLDFLFLALRNGWGFTNFDFTGDGIVDLADRDEWLALAGDANLPSGESYLLGDVNLDGFVDGIDFVEWNDSRFQETGSWSLADFNADGVTDGVDFAIWNENRFMSAAVPEPAFSLYLLGIAVCIRPGQSLCSRD